MRCANTLAQHLQLRLFFTIVNEECPTLSQGGVRQHGPRTLVPLCIQLRQLRRRLVHEPELALSRVEEAGAALTRALAATRVRPRT